MKCKHEHLGLCILEKAPAFKQAARFYCAGCEFYDGPPRGLGDVVHDVAKSTGIAHVTRKISGLIKKDCGCAARRQALNDAVPFVKESGLQ